MGSPGPATISVAATAAGFGLGKSLSYFAGIVAGTIAVVIAVVSGVTSLLFASPSTAIVLQTVGGLYIIWLAYKIATAPISTNQTDNKGSPAFTGGFLLAVANPKAYAAIGAAAAGVVIAPETPMTDALIKLVVLSTVVVFVNTVWLLLGGIIAKAWRRPKLGRALNVMFAAILLIAMAMTLGT